MFWNDIQRLRQQAAPQGQPLMASPIPTAAPTQPNQGFMTPSPGSGGPGLWGALQMARNPANQAQMRQRQMAQLLVSRPQMATPNIPAPSPIDGTDGSA